MSRVMELATQRVAEAARACRDLIRASATAIACPGEESSHQLWVAYREAGAGDASAYLDWLSEAIAMRQAAADAGSLSWWCAASLILSQDLGAVIEDVQWERWAPVPEVVVRTPYGRAIVVTSAVWTPRQEDLLESVRRTRPDDAEATLAAMARADVLHVEGGRVYPGSRAPVPRA